jgi:hypothetical protein
MTAVPWLLNTAWMLKCSAEAARFARASRNVAQTQSRLLLETLRANRDTEFGRARGFARILDARGYQTSVPPTTYDDFAADIHRIAAGETNILTREPIRLLEPTSGTTGGEKLIPYTAELRRQFQRGVAAWIYDLFRRRPALRSGRAYWSISPIFGPPRRSAGGLPIGFDDDTAYLGGVERLALRRLLITPPALTRLPDMDTFRYVTLLSLLAADDLTLISVWSPTFLTALLAPLQNWQEQLCSDLRGGTVKPPSPLARGLASDLCRWLRPNPRRAERLTSILGSASRMSDRLRAIWPRLALISCWTDAAAARFLPDLRELFPRVEIQPKGLLATEAIVSFPLIDQPGAALAVRSHFFEFEEDGSGGCRLAHELDRGGRYRILLTTGGGLYRYQLRDEVEVVGFHHQCPLIRFVGKGDAVCDLVGEKLAEPHLRTVLDRLLAKRNLQARFALVCPVVDAPARYHLYLQPLELATAAALLDEVQREFESGLMENPYYRHAVAVGQLAPAQVRLLDPAKGSAWQLYENRCIEDGQKCGNIKPIALDRRSGWVEVFARLESECSRDDI